MNEKRIKIERTTTNGYECAEHSISDAIRLLNTEIENKRTVFIDGRPFLGDFLAEADLLKCKNEVSVTNMLVGG